MRILIVEDEMIISEDIAMTLDDNGYTVIDQVVDYDDALTSIETNTPDLILLDINLRGQKDGINVAEWLKEKYNLPFIFTSSLGDPITIQRAKATNPSSYLIKPFKDEQLFAAIEVAMTNFSQKENVQEADKDDEVIPVINNAIFIKQGHKYSKVLIADIKYLHKSENYLELHTDKQQYVLRSSITNFISQLEVDKICRTHKSYAVNLDYVTGILPNAIVIGDTEIPLSRSYADSIKGNFRLF